jgi:dTDP-4-dehydrorhamnose reductase
LGTHLVNKIEGLGAIVYAPSHDDFDLVHENEIEKMYSSYPDVDVVIHAAKVCSTWHSLCIPQIYAGPL